jgi:hypothetical protein
MDDREQDGRGDVVRKVAGDPERTLGGKRLEREIQKVCVNQPHVCGQPS